MCDQNGFHERETCRTYFTGRKSILFKKPQIKENWPHGTDEYHVCVVIIFVVHSHSMSNTKCRMSSVQNHKRKYVAIYFIHIHLYIPFILSSPAMVKIENYGSGINECISTNALFGSVITVIIMAVRQIKQTILENFFLFRWWAAITVANSLLLFFQPANTHMYCVFVDYVFIKRIRCMCEQIMIQKSVIIFVQLITQVHNNLCLNDFRAYFSKPIQMELHSREFFFSPV